MLLKPKPKKKKQESYDEEVHLLVQRIVNEAEQLIDQDTKELWMDDLQTFARDGDIDAIVEAVKFRRKIVSMEEFLFEETYLGMSRDEVFPAVLKACNELDTGKYVEAVLKGALGTGKSTLANLMLAREIYKISCMRHPQISFGLQSKSSIVFTIQSVRMATARKAVFEEFGQFINHSPYFKHIYKYDHHITSQMVFREQNVSILPVSSSDTGAISMNVIGGVLDEMNFMQKVVKSKSSAAEMDGSYDQAKKLYNTLARRRKTRFTQKGKLPGILFVISSSRFPDDFTEIKATEAESMGGHDPNIFVFSHSQWSANRREAFMDESFHVQVGNERIASKVLKEGDKVHPLCEKIEVPMDFYQEFTKDVEGSLRDFAGVTTLATKPFITRRDAIYDCMKNGSDKGYENIFNVEEIDLSLGIPHPIKERIKSSVTSYRACHIDLGLTRDACGVAIGHVAGTKIIERRNEETGKMEVEILQVIGIEGILRIAPPPNGEIEFAQVRKLILMLRDDFHIPIEYITMDGFQSVDSRQIFKRQGFKTGYLSVEKIDPYRTLRDSLYDERLLLPRHQFLAKELAELEYVQKGQVEKVDHRPNGSKDVADAVCGVVAFLLKRRSAWAGIAITGRTGTKLFEGVDEEKDEDEDLDKDEKTKQEIGITGRPRIQRRSIQRQSTRRRPSSTA